MRLSYFVSEKDYLSALLYLLRRKIQTPLGGFTAFVLTIGQFLAVIGFCIAGLITGPRAIFLVILSGIVFAMNGILYLPTPQKAKILFARMKKGGQWDAEYEKKHTLTWEEDKLVLQYGKVRRKLPAASISQVVKWKNALLVMTGDVLYCVVPESAWKEKGNGSPEDLIREIRDRKFAEYREAILEKREALENEGKKPYRYHYTKERYLSDLKEAHRKAYTMGFAWRGQALIRIGGAVLLFALWTQPLEQGWKVLATAAALILLFPYIRTFSFLLNLSLERGVREVLTFCPGTEAEFYVSEQELVFLGDIHCLVIPWGDVLAVKKLSGGLAFYLKNQLIVPLPGDGEELFALVQRKGE
ncbi:hypothetical protein [Hominifimenecus sp. rT4P-3]|uniref:hypothetical protein n=1 Tax=Hominifimenecus sp. rT4P-3 TaxID=3242979 RepID=UPI003DA68961